ncbi:MAG: class I SAM-dependent methyltransferase [Firmicutes bacterium]|nr:class I SAM-dependent methyltransferase [Bacillota bacterium]
MLETWTPAGLHEFVARQIAGHFGTRRGRAIDLGAGTGAFAVRLRELGFDVLAVDHNAGGYKADLPFLELDLNRSDFAEVCGLHSFPLVVAIEVIEHVESPIEFLRNVGRLLTTDGLAFITTPNVDNLPARVKFLLRGKIRAMDESSEPTHISPIFLDLLRRQYLVRAGLRMVQHVLYPPGDYHWTRRRYAWAFRLAARWLPGDGLAGDNHVFVLAQREQAQ